MTYITLEELHTALNAVDALSLKGAEVEVRCVTDAIRRIRFIGHDAVEVVRCKECRHYKEREDGFICECDYSYKDDDFYCADGEKNDAE